MKFGRRDKKIDIGTSGLPVEAPLPGRRERVDYVTAAESLAIMTEVFRPIVGDMTVIRLRHWVKELSDGVRATLDLDPYRATYEFHYGISCEWVPRLEAGRFMWRRTLKQTRRCLWVSH